MKLFNDIYNKKLKGLKLYIDEDINLICEISNKSSSHTRSIIYVLLIISITAIIAVINTWPLGNWTKERVENISTNLNSSNNSKTKDSNKIDSLKIELNTQIHNKSENIGIVELPIIGNKFDVNNLSIFTGLSFIITLLILIYTASREKRNLRLALHAITQRYPDVNEYPNKDILLHDLKQCGLIQHYEINFDGNTKYSINKFNKTRRRYHYNYLTMNEVFNTPDDALTALEKKRDPNSFKSSLIGSIVESHFLYFPFAIYLLVFVNDCLSLPIGSRISNPHALTQCIISYLILSYISILCHECNYQKLLSLAYFKDFIKDNNYRYEYDKFKDDKPNRKRPFWFIFPLHICIQIPVRLIKYLYNYLKFFILNKQNKHRPTPA